jgi:hypothetical protein
MKFAKARANFVNYGKADLSTLTEINSTSAQSALRKQRGIPCQPIANKASQANTIVFA